MSLFFTWLAYGLSNSQVFCSKLWQFRNIRRYSSGLIFGEQLGGRPPARLTLIIDIGELLPVSVATMKQAAGRLRSCDGVAALLRNLSPADPAQHYKSDYERK